MGGSMMSTKVASIAYLLGIALGLCVGLPLGFCMAESQIHKEAIKHNAAQYKIVDENFGTIKFIWKDEK